MDQTGISERCAQCHVGLADHRITIAEDDRSTYAVGEWALCSWACARELVIRVLRMGGDER